MQGENEKGKEKGRRVREKGKDKGKTPKGKAKAQAQDQRTYTSCDLFSLLESTMTSKVQDLRTSRFKLPKTCDEFVTVSSRILDLKQTFVLFVSTDGLHWHLDL